MVFCVAPRVGAWIETNTLPMSEAGGRSPPVWGRGLKPEEDGPKADVAESPPVWGRGLKPTEARRAVVPRRRPPCGGVD